MQREVHKYIELLIGIQTPVSREEEG